MHSYTRTSPLKQSKEDRTLHKENCQALRIPIVEGMESSDYTITELEQAISKLKINKASGADDIAPRLITNLPGAGKERLLKIINSSWNQGYTPTMWRRATSSPYSRNIRILRS